MTNRFTQEDIDKRLKENPDLKVAGPNPMSVIAQFAPWKIKKLQKEVGISNKYHAVRTYSELCNRTFDSKAEARRGEELRLLEMAGDIHALQYQIPFILCKEPKITVTIDFYYMRFNQSYYEDVKGILTRDSRTKYAWLQDKHGIDVELIR